MNGQHDDVDIRALGHLFRRAAALVGSAQDHLRRLTLQEREDVGQVRCRRLDTRFRSSAAISFSPSHAIRPQRYHGNVNREPPFDRKPGEAQALSKSEIDDVIAFLRTLNDAEMEADIKRAREGTETFSRQVIGASIAFNACGIRCRTE